MTQYGGQLVARDRIQGFIPNVWRGEVRRFRDQRFIMQAVTTRKNFIGKQGDTYYEPLVGRAAVYKKLPNQPVVLQARNPEGFTMKIDQYNESSFGIEDIVEIQSQYNQRMIYTKEAGYALGRDLDNSILAMRAAVPATHQIYVSTTGDTTGIPQAINDAALLAAKAILDELDVPEEDRYWVVSPRQYVDLLAIDKFISRDFVNSNPVQNGKIGSLYGYPVWSSSNVKPNSLDGLVNGDGAIPQPTPGVQGSPYLPTQEDEPLIFLPRGQVGNETTRPFVTAMLCHKDWSWVAVQKNITSEGCRIPLYLSDAYITSHVFGVKRYRKDHAVNIHTAP